MLHGIFTEYNSFIGPSSNLFIYLSSTRNDLHRPDIADTTPPPSQGYPSPLSTRVNNGAIFQKNSSKGYMFTEEEYLGLSSKRNYRIQR